MSSHQRFLLTGVKVGLEATEPCASSTKEKLSSVEEVSEAIPSQPMSKRGGMVSFTVESEELMPRQLSGNGTLPTNEAPLAGGGTIIIPGGVPEWCLDEYRELTDFSQNYGIMDCVSSTVCFLLLLQFYHAPTLKCLSPCLATKNSYLLLLLVSVNQRLKYEIFVTMANDKFIMFGIFR